MRTRFLNIDYFKASNGALDELNFLRLPVPHFPPSNICFGGELCCFDSVLSVSLDVEGFSIDDALSRFFSDVLPHSIVVEIADFPDFCAQNRNDCTVGRKRIAERTFSISQLADFRSTEERRFSLYDGIISNKARNFGSELLDIEVIEENEPTGEDKYRSGFRVMQFESHELDFFLDEHLFFDGKEDGQIFSEILEHNSTTHMLDFVLGITIQYPHEATKSVYSVEEIASDYHMEERESYLMEDAGSAQDAICYYGNKLPLLEANEISTRCYTGPSMDEELHFLFENIGYQNLTEEDVLVIDNKELLRSMDTDVLECLPEQCSIKQCPQPELTHLDLALEMEFINVKEENDLKEVSAVSLEMSGGGSFPVTNLPYFQEFQILDLDYKSFEAFSGSQTIKEPEACAKMFKEDTDSICNFYESIVSHELTLADDSFKPLPIPVVSDGIDVQLMSTIIEEILVDSKPHLPSASDGIYLDWHFLEEDGCRHDIFTTQWNILEGIDTYSTDYESFNTELVVTDFVYFEDIPDGSNVLERKEILNEITSVDNKQVSSSLSKYECETGKENLQPSGIVEKVVPLSEMMSNFNDLEFFLNPHRAAIQRNSEPAVKDTPDNKAEFSVVSPSNSISACASTEAKLQKWDIEVHQVKLSDNILDLIVHFQKIYLEVLESSTDLKKNSSSVVNDINLLSIKKQKLMDWIKYRSAGRTTLACSDETLVAFATLYAIKQMASYLCFYGIHVTSLYVNKLCRSFNHLKLRLSFLQSSIENELQKADIKITESHPSLSVIQEILLAKTSENGKVLIVADQVFWCPLKRLLNSMGVLFHEVQNIQKHADQPDAWDGDEGRELAMQALQHSDCLLISQEHFTASLPFNKFRILLEYGGSYSSSRISTICPKVVGLPFVHFLKVELDECIASKALCEGVYVPESSQFIMGETTQSIPTLYEGIYGQKFEELLNVLPIEESFQMEILGATDHVETCSVPMTGPSVSSDMESKQIQSTMPSYPDIVLVVNTQNFDKEMLISRRSSYQRILALEKQGVQVVEREMNLPVDLVISAAMCLVWYDYRNIGQKTTSTEEASSSIPLCIENIATNILTSLSFAFSNCILVFEGERNFLASTMESSDAIYAAAASLGVDLQLFYSYSCELTDEIILGCIRYAIKLNRGLYPKMLESETLAESFLTSFPSINPLLAHAILCSGGLLVEFLNWSHDRRIREIGKYHVPDESLALFGALCRFGELEECKSGMTECSSVSSAPDSGDNHSRSASDRKKRKYLSASTLEIPMDDLQLDRLNQSTGDNLKSSRMFQPFQSWNFGKGPQTLDKIEGSSYSLNDQLFGPKWGLNIFRMDNVDYNGNSPENMQEDFRGEVVEPINSSLMCEDFPSIANPFRMPNIERDHITGNFITTRSSFGPSNHPSFPMSEEISSSTDIWNLLKDHKPRLEENICGYPTIDANKGASALRQQEMLDKRTIQGSNRNVKEQLSQDSGTVLSNSIRSSQIQQASPWTIKFLNRIKEKSRAHRLSLPCETAITSFGYSGNAEKITKRKSPSTFDHYRYQGGSNPKKTIKQKRQKSSTQPTSSKNEKIADSILPTWTPIDKRARQTLSFVRNASGTQSKLVWSNRNLR
ncbi:PREDICTED: uncharacterized protein LOC104608724 [Nelumbo nucifera]|uniref:Uncharacterized protein LOC104608724 n=2 Tax=Nelumbo nucifera TaxID=4432 RepID=A0A1U8B1M6_NELNU|nr:PREDICTED: uncharacterized protein LOC104608724 [Nelumbo nucifera]XP_010273094.1 PREDICTED: uncharacterized protein LOC104608724 [Nelumbo nucifera]DAD47424.1 TPA_asm: hypothetical protein HUJ06_017361 [Nelumbo nucifera]